MKKNILFMVVALLCLNFLAFSQNKQAVDLSTVGIKVGDKLPDVVLANVFNVKGNHLAPADFRGKVLILDFFATWCSPCVAMLPKMDSLQRAFKSDLAFISVTQEAADVVVPFMAALENRAGRHYDIPIVVKDEVLNEMFPHVYLPHYVWVNRDGMVDAITGFEEVTEANVRKMLLGAGTAALKKKRDKFLPFDESKPMLLEGNGGGAEGLRYYSFLKGYTEGLGGYYKIFPLDTVSGRRIVATNVSLKMLYQMAYRDLGNFQNSATVLDVKDVGVFGSRGSGLEREAWYRKYALCYELDVPSGFGQRIYERMRSDLEMLFPQYAVSVSEMKKKCLVLKAVGTKANLAPKNGIIKYAVDASGVDIANATLAYLVYQLNSYYLQGMALPVVDGTGGLGKVDLKFSAVMKSVKSINEGLKPHGLALVEENAVVKVLTIADKNR